ncbi:MAG TPA: hypothetical protein VGB03_06175, partial [Acidimicrobiales bacterium]
MRPDTRRLLLVLAVGLFVSGAGAVVIERTDRSAPAVAEDNPVAAVPESTTTTGVVGATPTTVAGPVSPPADPYAAEPIVELGTIEIPKIGLVHRLYHG